MQIVILIVILARSNSENTRRTTSFEVVIREVLSSLEFSTGRNAGISLLRWGGRDGAPPQLSSRLMSQQKDTPGGTGLPYVVIVQCIRQEGCTNVVDKGTRIPGGTRLPYVVTGPCTRQE